MSARLAILFAAGVVLNAPPLSAAPPLPAEPPLSAATPRLMASARLATPSTRLARPAFTETDSIRVARALAEAERFASAGRMAEARRQYREVIRQQLADGDYPGAAMWLLANAYFAAGNDFDAASTLDDLSAMAAEFGDPKLELRAAFESAVLYAKQHRYDRASALVVRVRKLLKSPAIEEDLKQEVRSRLRGQ
jgi:hypothetical protein